MFLIACSSILYAQQPKKNKAIPQLPASPAAPLVLDIKLFEQPNYQGRSGYFSWVNGKLTAPFPLSNISFEVPRGKIVYIRRCFEFPSEEAYYRSQENISLLDICGLRSDEKSGIKVEFNGISTSIHNNDCKKVYGNIKVKLIELSPDRDSVQSLMQIGTNPHRNVGAGSRRNFVRTEGIFTFVPFLFASAGEIPETYYRDHIYNNNPEPSIIYPRGRHGGIEAPAAAFFVAGRKALQEGRVKLLVVSDLGSAHKTCNLCDDFSSKIKMKTPAYESIPINIFLPDKGRVDTTGKKLVLGPYQARGSRDGSAITASAGTIKDFKVYFKLFYYND
jgi:hypothetical protein